MNLNLKKKKKKKIAVISDIHGNWEAFKMVLEDIMQRKVDAIYCLGDVIGYGPSPVECLDKAIEVCDIILLGNHEEAVLSGAFGFNPTAKQAVDWTRKQIKPSFFNKKKKKYWEYLKRMPLIYIEDDYTFVHGSPRDPTMEYILKTDVQDSPDKIEEVFSVIDKICFVGHSHMPGVIIEGEDKWYYPQDFDYVLEVNKYNKIICNVGSVGQPRDKDNRACYVTFDISNNEIFYHRVYYKFEKTQRKIEGIKELDNLNATRLEEAI